MKKSKKKRKSIGVEEIKILIAALSFLSTLGFWNIFSAQAREANQAPASEPVVLPTQPAPNALLDLPPMPTLVPANSAAASQPGEAPAQSLELRSVDAPPVQFSQSSNPLVIAGSKIEGNGGGGGGGGGGGSAPAAQTASS